jgi:predicted transcriptional regulator
VLFINDDVYRARKMANVIVGATTSNAQLQMLPPVYVDGAKLRLRQNGGWDFNRGSKRGQLEIKAEILCYCGQQKTKTNIMYNVNLNYAQLKKHLKSLTATGLLMTNKDKYATTQKGHRFLELFVQLNAILNC